MTQRTIRSSAVTQQALRTLWGERNIDPEQLEWREGTAVAPLSILPPERDSDEQGADEDTRGEDEWQRRLPLLLESAGSSLPQLVLHDVLGEGGMGVVYSAQQVALQRSVAVKLPHEDVEQHVSAPLFLREARVTGLLEHPNVVPVYALGRDASGRPLIVMRRITGSSWAEKLQTTTLSTHAGDDYLSTHLRILRQVAMAAHFAHDKGIVHRDIKPENVMVCSYGEVYLADWGVAVTTRADIPGVPRAADVCSIEGTPSYLAPEMAAGDGKTIDARTDVYLLGAVLHEVVTGAPPHQSDDIMQSLERAFISKPPQYGPEVPPRLAEIIRHAMARFSDDRYASAAHFAHAIDTFLEHRAAMDLVAEARQRLKKLKKMVRRQFAKPSTDAAPKSGKSSDSRKLDRKIRTLFNECRFAFAHALRNYPQVAPSKQGLRDTAVTMIGYELDSNRPDAAAGILRELRRPPEKLAARVERALEEQHDNEKRLRKLERDTDATFGAATRARLTRTVALIWGATCVIAGWLTRYELFVVGHVEFALLNAAFLVVVGIAAVGTRRTMMGSGPNRRLSAISALIFAGFGLLWLLLGTLGLSRQHTALVHNLMGAVVWTSAAISVDRRWALLSLAHCASFLLIWRFLDYHYEIMGVVVTLGSLATSWFSQRGPKPSAQ